MTWEIPASLIRDSRWVRNGTPAVGSIGLGAESVSGRSRVPLPPTRTTASTSGLSALHIPFLVGNIPDLGGGQAGCSAARPPGNPTDRVAAPRFTRAAALLTPPASVARIT